MHICEQRTTAPAAEVRGWPYKMDIHPACLPLFESESFPGPKSCPFFWPLASSSSRVDVTGADQLEYPHLPWAVIGSELGLRNFLFLFLIVLWRPGSVMSEQRMLSPSTHLQADSVSSSADTRSKGSPCTMGFFMALEMVCSFCHPM